MNKFDFVGTLSVTKDKDFHTTQTYSGGTIHKLDFSVRAGDNMHYLRITAFENDNPKDIVKTSVEDKDKKVTIPYAERNLPEKIHLVAPYQRFVLNTTGDPKSELKQEFITEYDYLLAVEKILKDEEARKKVWCISGNISFSYGDSKAQYYREFNPTMIYRAAEGTAPKATATVEIFYADNAFDKEYMSENGFADLVAYLKYYDSSLKKSAFTPFGIKVAQDNPLCGPLETLVKSHKGSICSLNVVVDLINGAQKTEITEAQAKEQLTDDDKMMISLGFYSEADKIAEIMKKGQVYGDRITQNRFVSVANKAAPKVEENLTIADLTTRPTSEAKATTTTTSTKQSAAPVDISEFLTASNDTSDAGEIDLPF